MQKILIANRGEIAVRIIRTCKALSLRTVAVYSDADSRSLHVLEADQALRLGPAPAAQSYLDAQRVLEAAKASGADAVHPGYGFLSEDADFARAVQANGLIWIGPTPKAMESMASKINARKIAEREQVPVVPGIALDADAPSSLLQDLPGLSSPVLLKAAAGGGGIGMREVHDLSELAEAASEVRDHAQRQFGSSALLVEILIEQARHVEVQIAGDRHGNVIHLFERDCSLQRRRQKLVEEAPAPGLSDDLRAALHAAAIRMATAVGYENVGTVEFIVKDDAFYFLEMNTRLQVEHGVTEAVTGLDLVALQLHLASGNRLPLTQAQVKCDGHAVETRVYAEDPASNFMPSVGEIKSFCLPGPSTRVDSGVAAGSRVTRHYDGLLCKLITHADTRSAATSQMWDSLAELCVLGVRTNQHFLRRALGSEPWADQTVHINLAEQLAAQVTADQQVGIAVMAATVWQFCTYPPAADQAPWPGGFAFERLMRWRIDGEIHRVRWQWISTDEFQFFDYNTKVRIVGRGSPEEPWVLEVDGVQIQVRGAETPTGLHVWTSTTDAKVLLPQPEHLEDEREVNAGYCRSPGPGQVLRVMVAPGQIVGKGEPLLVIESMKMESVVTAPRQTQIAAVNVEAGALIAVDQLLVSFEPDKGEAL